MVAQSHGHGLPDGQVLAATILHSYLGTHSLLQPRQVLCPISKSLQGLEVRANPSPSFTAYLPSFNNCQAGESLFSQWDSRTSQGPGLRMWPPWHGHPSGRAAGACGFDTQALGVTQADAALPEGSKKAAREEKSPGSRLE